MSCHVMSCHEEIFWGMGEAVHGNWPWRWTNLGKQDIEETGGWIYDVLKVDDSSMDCKAWRRGINMRAKMSEMCMYSWQVEFLKISDCRDEQRWFWSDGDFLCLAYATGSRRPQKRGRKAALANSRRGRRPIEEASNKSKRKHNFKVNVEAGVNTPKARGPMGY